MADESICNMLDSCAALGAGEKGQLGEKDCARCVHLKNKHDLMIFFQMIILTKFLTARICRNIIIYIILLDFYLYFYLYFFMIA